MEFNDKLKAFTNEQLLGIINNPDAHQQSEVETAKNIFSDRQLTDEKNKFAKEKPENEKTPLPVFVSRNKIDWKLIFTIPNIITNSIGIFLILFALKGFMIPNHFLDGGILGISLLIHEL